MLFKLLISATFVGIICDCAVPVHLYGGSADQERHAGRSWGWHRVLPQAKHDKTAGARGKNYFNTQITSTWLKRTIPVS